MYSLHYKKYVYIYVTIQSVLGGCSFFKRAAIQRDSVGGLGDSYDSEWSAAHCLGFDREKVCSRFVYRAITLAFNNQFFLNKLFSVKGIFMNQVVRENIKKYTLGTWQFGGLMDRDPNHDDKGDIDAIKMHINAGVNQIFTAQNYADGWAEKIVGEAIVGYERSSLLISSAIKKEDSAYDDMLRSVEESLKRLNLDYLDIVVHHAPIPGVPIKESIKALNEIVNRGLARGMAVSNYNSNSLSEAIASTNHQILFNQVYYNLFVREVEQDGLLEFCQKNKVLIQAFRPLELGELASSDNKQLVDLAKKYSVLPAQIALSWLTSQEGIAVVATTHDKNHLYQNLEAVALKIDQEDIEKLRKTFPVKKLEKAWIR